MSINITEVRMSAGGTKHEHIADLKWISTEDNSTGTNTTAAIVEFIDVKKGQAFVASSDRKVPVGVVKQPGVI